LNTFLSYGQLNSIIISSLIILISLLLGLINCKNKFHLFLIISICYLIFLFFYFFVPFYGIIQDYVSIPVIPFIFSFLYVNIKNDIVPIKEMVESKMEEN